MSNLIPVTFVNSFASNVWHLAQQKGSRLAPLARNEVQKAEKAFYDSIGMVSAQKKIGRHSDVTYSDTPHARRACFIEDYFWADLVDNEDKLRMIYSPENDYVVAAKNAFGRQIDDVIIAALLGTAYSGKDGSTAAVLPNSQKMAAHDGSTTTGVGLNVQTLRAAKKKFAQNEVDGEQLEFICDAEAIDSMLGQLQVTSEDFNSVKALVNGAVDSFMGFKFTRSERLPASASNVTYTVTNGTIAAGTGTITASKSKRCIAFVKSGILLAKAQDIMASIDRLPTKHGASQIYVKMTIGAARLEEVKVLEVITSTL